MGDLGFILVFIVFNWFKFDIIKFENFIVDVRKLFFFVVELYIFIYFILILKCLRKVIVFYSFSLFYSMIVKERF